MPPVFRFAPSPNGYLHLGHALSALLNADMARAAVGRLLLRIEDIDETRCRAEYEAAIYEDLAWLDIAWEQPVRRQSEHYDDYSNALRRLEEQALVYPSFRELVTTGATYEHWSRFVVMSFFAGAAIILVVTRGVGFALHLLQDRVTYLAAVPARRMESPVHDDEYPR